MALVPSTNCDHCESGKIENAEYFCHTCKHGLCKACKNKHDKIPDTRGHNVTLYERIDRSVFSTSLNCDIHNEGLSIFCDSCHCLICNKCVTTTHKNHQFSDVSIVVAEMKQVVECNLKRVDTKIKQISKMSQGAKTYLQQISENVKKFTSAIESINDTISHILGSQINIGITEYEDFEHLKKEEVKYALKKLDCAYSEYISVQSELGNVLTEKHNVKFILDNQIILTHVSNLEDVSKAELDFANVRCFDPDLFIADFMDKICKQHSLSYTSVRCKSDIEKENMSLKLELSEALDSIEKLKREYSDFSEKFRNVTSKLHEAERQMGEQKDTIENQKQENREIYKEKKDLENKLRLVSINEEQPSLGKDCKDLKILLQQKQKEVNNLKSRFQELAESSEALNKIIKNLHQEKSDLKHRLEIDNEEKSSILKKNKELKNIIQEKLAEVERLEKRLQEYATELEGIPSLKRRIENLQTDNADLEKRGKLKDGLLQKSESTVQKMQKDKQKLQIEIISQKQNYDTLNIKLESLKNKNLELDDRLRRRFPVAEQQNCQNCFKYRNDISDLKRKIHDLRDRLSEASGNNPRDNSPNIADLSDMNRPTSLAEKFSSLHTDEYTDAMEVIEDDLEEADSVNVMLGWLKSCYAWCQRLAKDQRNTLMNRTIGFMEDYGGQNVVLSDRCLIFVKEFQKKIAVESLAVVGQICHVKSVTQQTLSSENYIVKYIKKCSELCWMMQISDPPLYLNFDVHSGENLNKNDYNVFTKSGSKIDYLVWPVLYLHKSGPMLAKGVAQGK